MTTGTTTAGWPTVTGLPGSPHAVFEDDSLPHQIRLFVSGHEISVTCTCLGARNQAHQIIASRTGAFPAAAAMAAYRQWHTDHGELVWP